MALKAVLETLDGLEDSLKALYEKKGDKFVLILDGAESHPDVTALKNALDRQKEENKTVKTQIATLTEQVKKFEGLEPDKLRDMLKNVENSEESKLISEGKIDEVVKRRTERSLAEMQNKITSLESEKAKNEKAIAEMNAKLANYIIDGSIRKAATEAGLIPEAVEDAVLLGRTVFVVENDEPTARDSSGNLIPGSNNGKLTPTDWFKNVKEKRKHWWPASNSDNAPGKPSPTGDLKVNPWKKETQNLTQQGQMVKNKPDLARQYMRDAGVPEDTINRTLGG